MLLGNCMLLGISHSSKFCVAWHPWNYICQLRSAYHNSWYYDKYLFIQKKSLHSCNYKYMSMMMVMMIYEDGFLFHGNALSWMWWLLCTTWYDAVSDVVESGVHWRSNFQIGSGVLKNCYRPNLMHIYGTQCDFMHRSCWIHSNFENSLFYYVIWTSDPQNHCLLRSRSRVPVNFWIGMSYIGRFHVKEHVQGFQNMYCKGG